jgi:Xaa-Pro aminopeptidase
VARYFPQEEYEDRWRRVYAEMRSRGFESAVIWGQSAGTYERCGNVLYLTNYYSSQSGHEEDTDTWMGVGFSAVLLSSEAVPTLVTDMPDPDPEQLAVEDVIWEANVVMAVVNAMRDRGIRDEVALVGYDFLPAKYFHVLEKELPDVRFVPADDLLAGIRRNKSPRELDCYREGGEKATAALTSLMETAVKGGVTQAEAAAAGAAELMRNGGFPHMVPVSSGRGIYRFTGDPITGFSSNITLNEGDMVRAWVYGPAWQGYWLDPGRTAVVGRRPTARQKDLIEQGAHIIDRLIEKIQPSTRVAEVVQLGIDMRRKTGTVDDQPAKMWPLFGHGVGLFWEHPWLLESAGGEENDATFLENDVLGIEIFLHWPDTGSVGIEQNVIVGKDRNELLTPVDMFWW